VTPAEALKAARNAGIALCLDDDALVLKAATPPPPTIVDALRTHKQGIVLLLQAASAVESLAGGPLPPSSIDELRVRLALAVADPERAGGYLNGEASVVSRADQPGKDYPEPIPLAVPLPSGCLHPMLAVRAVSDRDADRAARCWVRYSRTTARPRERVLKTGQCAWGLRCVVSRAAGVVQRRRWGKRRRYEASAGPPGRARLTIPLTVAARALQQGMLQRLRRIPMYGRET
jgi:hypothetical protein